VAVIQQASLLIKEACHAVAGWSIMSASPYGVIEVWARSCPVGKRGSFIARNVAGILNQAD
jgi:hypothetical protein